MSYLERLKSLKTATIPTDKTDKSPFDPFVSTYGSRISEKTVPINDIPELTPDELSDIHEAIDERAAIQEYEGGLPRAKAEHAAKAAMHVYRYRLTDNPDTWLTMIAPGCDLKEAKRVLNEKFGGGRVIDVKNNYLFSMK